MLFLDLVQEKKPYIDKAAELKASVDNGEGSGVSYHFSIALSLSNNACLLSVRSDLVSI